MSHRSSRGRQYRRIFVAVVALIMPHIAAAENALELLSGFDAQRLDGVYPIQDNRSVGEMAKLLYRLRKADASALAERRGPAADVQPGDVRQLAGVIRSARQYPVPESLRDVLQLDAFYEVTFEDEATGRSSVVFTPPLAGRVEQGDRIVGDAVLVKSEEANDYFAAGKLAWMPAKSDRPGWKLLSQQGVDVGQIAAMKMRNRRPLEAEDAEAFYAVLAAAKRLSERPAETLPPPDHVDPVDLLKTPTDYHGQWIRISANTVRVTRVAVEDPEVRRLLSQDHYYQVDASGDLGDTIVQLQRPEGEGGDPILMSGSYPISFVAAELPAFLAAQLDGGRTVVAMVGRPVAIEGFFLRLWSYENEFMTRQGGGKQVGPLIVVSRWHSRQQAGAGADGIAVIGYALAAAIIAAILGTLIWTRRNARADERARQRSAERETIELPPM